MCLFELPHQTAKAWGSLQRTWSVGTVATCCAMTFTGISSSVQVTFNENVLQRIRAAELAICSASSDAHLHHGQYSDMSVGRISDSDAALADVTVRPDTIHQ